MLAGLKETPLYDKEREQWNRNMDEKQQLIGSDRFSTSQLLGVLAENIK